MIQFIVGLVAGSLMTLFALVVWAVFEEDREQRGRKQ